MTNIDKFFIKYQKEAVIEYENRITKNPAVSVIVQTYQHAPYIAHCLDSILMQQTNFDFEIIIGEDQSSDGTREICIDYAKKNPDKIRLFLNSRQNNIKINGIATGIFNSVFCKINIRGDYIALCEGDDFWTDPLKLQKQFDFLIKNPSFSACSHLTDVIFDKVQVKNVNRFNKNKEKTVFRTKDLLEFTQFHTSSLFYRTKIVDIEEYLNYDFNFFRDHPFMIILSTIGPIKRIPEVMSVYRRNQGGISERISKDMILKVNIDMINALSDYLKNFKLESFYMKGHWYRNMIDKQGLSFEKKFYYFLYFFFSSFYIFPKNGKKILRTLKKL